MNKVMINKYNNGEILGQHGVWYLVKLYNGKMSEYTEPMFKRISDLEYWLMRPIKWLRRLFI